MEELEPLLQLKDDQEAGVRVRRLLKAVDCPGGQ